MTTINEQFQQYADLQKQFLEPARAFGGIAADTFERMAREGYEVFGDYIEYAIGQARLAGEAKDVTDLFGQQLARSRVFGEKMAQRAQEYVSIATAAQREVNEVATAQAANATATSTAKK